MSMTERRTGRLYDRWSKVYDRTFVPMTLKRQRIAIAQLPLRPADRILDLGVGTGVTLSLYPRFVRVVGMDLSGGMLGHAARKCRQFTHCSLVQGDALCPPFADRSFDHAMISHTISVVSDPARVMRWAARLVKPGGRIVVLNHFCSSRPLVAALEKVVNPLCMRLGWRADLSMESVVSGPELELEYCFRLGLADPWKIVVLRQPTNVSRSRPARDRWSVARDPSPLESVFDAPAHAST
jgi:phosphatidylethanolamine/phosphatidyl-N-methylethanolamine N-methyltransferase